MAVSPSHSRNHHVRQRESCDCVVATVAAVANMSYAAVAELSPVKPGKRGLFPLEIRRLLQNATGIKWKYPRHVFFRQLSSFAQTEDALVLAIREPGNFLIQAIARRMSHCIYVRNGQVFDPVFSYAHSFCEYPRLDWTVRTIYYPKNPEQLKELQRYNDQHYRKARLWSEILGK